MWALFLCPAFKNLLKGEQKWKKKRLYLCLMLVRAMPFELEARHAISLVEEGRKKTIEDIKTAIFEGIDGAARKGLVSISIDENTLALLQVLKAKDEVINHLKMYGYRITESEYTYNLMIWWDK